MHLDLIYDQTRATNATLGTNMPRIPARRLGLRYEYQNNDWLFGLEGRWHDKASHLAPNALPTDSYTLWNADVRYVFELLRQSLSIYSPAHNLGDEEARPHTSFLKDLAPMSRTQFETRCENKFLSIESMA